MVHSVCVTRAHAKRSATSVGTRQQPSATQHPRKQMPRSAKQTEKHQRLRLAGISRRRVDSQNVSLFKTAEQFGKFAATSKTAQLLHGVDSCSKGKKKKNAAAPKQRP